MTKTEKRWVIARANKRGNLTLLPAGLFWYKKDAQEERDATPWMNGCVVIQVAVSYRKEVK